MEQVGVDADAAAPKAVGWGWRRENIFFGVRGVDHVVLGVGVGAEFFVTGEAYGDRDNRLEALLRGHVGHEVAFDFARRVEDEHTQPDERVAEEDRNAEEDEDEKDVNFLADILVGEGDSEVCGVLGYMLGICLGKLTDCQDAEQETARDNRSDQLSSCRRALHKRHQCAAFASLSLPVTSLVVPSPPAPPLPSLSIDLGGQFLRLWVRRAVLS
jgi:hypothetical protein